MGKLGSETLIGFRLQSVFDTALSAGPSHKLEVSNFNGANNTSQLRRNPIGSGLLMQKSADIGSTAPSIAIEKEGLYDDAGNAILAAFFGGASVTSLGSGAYRHDLIFNPTRRYGTLAHNEGSTQVKEYVNTTPQSINISASPNDYMKMSFDLLATLMRMTGTVNTNSTLQGVTVPNERVVIVRPDNRFRINAQAGSALANGDKVDCTSIEIALGFPLELVGEIRGQAGNGAPRASGNPPFTATITVNLKSLEDQTWFSALEAGTEYKADFIVTGETIGGGYSYQFGLSFPRLKVISDPTYNLANTGENPQTVVFEAMVAPSVPSGMISTYPYGQIINNRSTTYFS